MFKAHAGNWQVKFQPYAMTMQSRFRFRAKEETDNFRRLMDATIFPVDWMGPSREGTILRHGGHWTHLVTCGHCIAPWEYPNFYPPVGSTRWVSKLTMNDTSTQVRCVSMQGEAIYKHFTCRHTQFIHTNLKLDLAVIHAEQQFLRHGELKMLWMQNEGWVKRPRLEILEDLQQGDFVWIYGFQAMEEGVIDQEKPKDPLMVPVGVKAYVKSMESEHFYVEKLPEEPDIVMGLCGAPVIRDGKCVGMLTAKVHEDSENKVLAGTAMCTYAADIRSFLLEVEKQMINNQPQAELENQFTERRRAENGGKAPNAPFVDWDNKMGKLARHYAVPVSTNATSSRVKDNEWKEETERSRALYGKHGVFNQETQENMGLDMTESTIGEHPEKSEKFSRPKPVPKGYRRDVNQDKVGIHGLEGNASDWQRKTDDDLRSEQVKEFIVDEEGYKVFNEGEKLRTQFEKLKAKREHEEFASHVFAKRSGLDSEDGTPSEDSKPEWDTGMAGNATTNSQRRGFGPKGPAQSSADEEPVITTEVPVERDAQEEEPLTSQRHSTTEAPPLTDHQKRMWEKKMARRKADEKREAYRAQRDRSFDAAAGEVIQKQSQGL